MIDKSKALKNEKTYSQSIGGGRGELYLQGNRSPVYQVRVWLPEERKYLRKSLKTRDLETAVQRADDLVFETYANIAAGKKFFGLTLGELCQKYLDYRWEDVEKNERDKLEGITKGRWQTIKSQLNHFLTIKSPSLKVAELDKNSLYDWRKMRSKKTPNTSLVTIRNEQATINAMFAYGYRLGYTHIPKLEFAEIKIKQDQIGKRSSFTPEEYKKVTDYFRSWTAAKNCKTEKEKKDKEDVRDFILILSNTAMRLGELRALRWDDIDAKWSDTDERGRKVELVRINIRAETSKHRASRTIVCRGGEYFDRVRERSSFKELDDYVFTNTVGGLFSRKVLDDLWKDLMNKTGFPNYKEKKLTYYSLRHFAISLRLRDPNATIFEVAKHSGTGTDFINLHYGEVFEDDKTAAALRNRPFTEQEKRKEVVWKS